jgi:uncharacterized protein
MMRSVPARVLTWAALLIILFTVPTRAQDAQSAPAAQSAESLPSDRLPQLTKPINDFANVIDASQRAEIERLARTLMNASGDVVIVTTVDTFAPYGSIQEYAVKLFENHGRGIGEKGKDNGLLVLLAVKDRQVWIEVGYGLEGFITDGFSGETSRQYMIPYFRKGQYGEGVRVGVARVIARIAEGRNISLEGVHAPPAPESQRRSRGGRIPFGFYVIVAIILFNVISGALGGGGRRRRGRWGGGGWSGWSGGVGGFGGGGGSWGGGFGGGGGGGGFGGFGGGRSGGGGGGGSW